MGQARPWSLDPSPGLPAPGLGPGPDPAWDRAQAQEYKARFSLARKIFFHLAADMYRSA